MKRSPTDSSSPENVTPEETARAIASGVARLDLDRAAAYAGLRTLRTAKATALRREEKLLARKYGANHPRIAELSQRREANTIFERDLAIAHTLAATPPPPVDPKAYSFHGHVVGSDEKPLEHRTVALYNAKGEWIKDLGYGCSDSAGYFLLERKSVEGVEKAGVVATIRVYDGKELVHTEAEPLRVTSGRADYRRITIRAGGACTPPPGPPDESPPPPVTVPDVLGEREAAAKANLERAGFTVESNTRGADSKNVGRVIEQKPAGGSKAAPGSGVTIVVGMPQPKVAVPEVTGRTLREAEALLEKADLSVGRIEPSDAPLRSRVLKQSPAAGAQAEPGTAVDLVVEPPVEKVIVPKVVKLALGEAKKAIAKSGLTVGKINPARAGDTKIVVEQSPAAGTEVEQWDAVHLSVEEGPDQVVVPRLARMKLPEAKKTLEKARLKVGRINPPDASAKGIVTRQSPAEGAEVEEGTSVDLDFVCPPAEEPRQDKSGCASFIPIFTRKIFRCEPVSNFGTSLSWSSGDTASTAMP
jgi:beta-lactam-binding protein with PASTA domain